MDPKFRNLLVPTTALAVLWATGVAMLAALWWFPWLAAMWTAVVALIACVMVAGAGSTARPAAPAPSVSATSGDRDVPFPRPRQHPSAFPSPGSDAHARRETLVAVAGVGDIGSRAAVFLVQSGVGRLAVADIDVVEAGNIGQSSFRAIDVGHSKVEAIERICREINPGLEMRRCEGDLRKVPDLELGMWIGGASLLVLAVDDPPALLRLHDLFYRRLPMVASGVHDGGVSGHVVFTIPGQTACLRCALGLSGTSDLVQVRGNSASAEDVQRVAGETASAVMALLDAARAAHLPTRRNVLFISNRDSAGSAPHQSSWLEPRRDPRCRVCGGGPPM